MQGFRVVVLLVIAIAATACGESPTEPQKIEQVDKPAIVTPVGSPYLSTEIIFPSTDAKKVAAITEDDKRLYDMKAVDIKFGGNLSYGLELQEGETPVTLQLENSSCPKGSGVAVSIANTGTWEFNADLTIAKGIYVCNNKVSIAIFVRTSKGRNLWLTFKNTELIRSPQIRNMYAVYDATKEHWVLAGDLVLPS